LKAKNEGLEIEVEDLEVELESLKEIFRKEI